MAQRARDAGPYTPARGVLAGQTFSSARQYRNALQRLKTGQTLSEYQRPRLRARRAERREERKREPAYQLRRIYLRGNRLYVDGVQQRISKYDELHLLALEWHVKTEPGVGVVFPSEVYFVVRTLDAEHPTAERTLVPFGEPTPPRLTAEWKRIAQGESPYGCFVGGWVARLDGALRQANLPGVIGAFDADEAAADRGIAGTLDSEESCTIGNLALDEDMLRLALDVNCRYVRT